MRASARPFIAALVAVLAVLAPASAASAGAAKAEVVQVDSSQYPEVRVTLSVPGANPGDVTAKRLVLTENGEEREIQVDPVAAVGLRIALVIDASGSMTGAPLDNAKEAASSFVDALPADAKIAVIGFADEAYLVTPSTNDRSAIQDGIASLETRGGTALYDGVAAALDTLGATSGARQFIVALSDGANDDTHSKITPDAVAARVASRGVGLIGIALESSLGSGGQLRKLTDAVGGETYAATDPVALEGLYLDVADELSSLVDVTFQSVPGQADGDIGVSLDGAKPVTTSITYGSGPGGVDLGPPQIVDVGGGMLSGGWVPWAAALLMAGGVICCVLLVQGGGSRREELEDVLTSFDDQPPAAWLKAEEDFSSRTAVVGGLAESMTGAATKLLARRGQADSIDVNLERAGLAIRAGELGAFVLTTALAGVTIGFLLGGPTLALILLVTPVVATPLVIKFLQKRRRKKFADQLGDTLMLISGALKAGYGLLQALDSVAVESPAPTCEEFSRVLLETRLGLGIEDALDAVGDRMQCEDFEWVVNAVKINATVGGDLSGILDQVGETIRARNKIRRQVDALAAEGKISALVLFALPPGLVFFISMSNPDYIAPMFSTSLGKAMLGMALLMMLAGGAWLKKIVTPEF